MKVSKYRAPWVGWMTPPSSTCAHAYFTIAEYCFGHTLIVPMAVPGREFALDCIRDGNTTPAYL